MKEIKLKERKRLLVKMLVYLDAVCKNNNIHYSLIGGSLIGAIRHDGFIPWDDDIDIILMPKDYNKLMRVLAVEKNDRYKILDPMKNTHYYYPFAKLVDTNTVVIEDNVKKMDDYGLYIDIFCFHCVSNSKMIRRLQYFIQTKIKRVLGINLSTKHTANRFKSLMYLLIRLMPTNLIKKLYIRTWNTSKHTKYVLSDWPVYRFDKEIQLARNLKMYSRHSFEGVDAMIFSDYNEILSTAFGDYMKLPPISERKTHHFDKAYWKNECGGEKATRTRLRNCGKK